VTIDTIIFDIGGVLAEGGDRKQMFTHLKLAYDESEREIWYDYRVGKIGELQYFERVLAKTPFAGEEKDYAARARGFWKNIPEGFALQYLKPLKLKGYRLAILSNHSREWGQLVVETHKLHEYCRPILISAAMGVAKPDPAAFERAVSAVRRKQNPERCLFLDDQFENIVAARAVGMKATRVSNEELINNALRDYQIHLK
jgi:putative hydrolase of the HAD superfamily